VKNLELKKALNDLPEWSLKQNKIYRELKFAGFMQAIQFMQKAATFCEALDHHPEWFNCYNRLEIWLTTHDTGGVTEKDIALAKAFDQLILSDSTI